VEHAASCSHEMTNMKLSVAGGAAALVFVLFAGTPSAAENSAESGQAVYKRANCVGCHKWHGDGGGGYGGAALSLRKTELDKQQIMDTVKCGRPGTGMPYFSHDSYPPNEEPRCYSLSAKDLETMHVAQANIFLRTEEIAAVADYVLGSIKGKGDPNLADCTAFFGEESKACDVYRGGGHHALPTPTTTQ
jgi:mono/diheme cytochrome c family protein